MGLTSIPSLVYPIKSLPGMGRQTGVLRLVADSITRGLQRPTARDPPRPAAEDTAGDKDDDVNLDPNDARLIKFARFVDGSLELFTAKTDELEYVAFSHVWGDWEWRRVPGISYEVKASQEKADFIANDLPALVGDGAFWMDTLTVDQRDEKEVLAIVDAIPAIFKMAKRTIAVRESDGFYDCCAEAVAGFKDWSEFRSRFIEHDGGGHDEYVCVESYLQRLWTLQECLLSHTIQFVVGKCNKPTKRRPRTDNSNPYAAQVDSTVILDSLWVLAFCCKGIGVDGESGIAEFHRAYVHGGTVVNQNEVFTEEHGDLHGGAFMAVNLASRRSATMPRDYILATMPQFPWYKYPRKKALTMTFGEIYMDLYQQSASAGHAFTCRFTRSMLDPAENDPVTAWLPSTYQPDPRCLGDFLKLMGHRVPEVSNGNARHVHLTTVVTATEFCGAPGPDSILFVLEDSMRLFQEQWQESHVGGEISKYGNFPDADWTLDRLDALRRGWMAKDPRWGLYALEQNGTETVVGYGPSLDYDEDDLLHLLGGMDVFDTDEDTTTTKAKEDADSDYNYTTLLQHTRQILDHMWCAHNPKQVNSGQKDDWRAFLRQMRGRWSAPLLRTMLLFAAMIACRIPLSAAGWVNRLFVPVYVQYGVEGQGLIIAPGLLARTARQADESARGRPRTMLSVGQHGPEPQEALVTVSRSFGRDHFLVDLARRVPVGILPDFLADDVMAEEYVRAASAVYAGTCKVVG